MVQHLTGAPTDGSAAPVSGHGLLQVAWRRKLLISLVTGLFFGLAAVYYVRAERVYQSTAQVLVVQKRPGAVTGVDSRELPLEDYAATHQVLIRSPLIIGRACTKRNLGSLPSLAGEVHGEPLTERIIKALTVARGKGPTGKRRQHSDPHLPRHQPRGLCHHPERDY